MNDGQILNTLEALALALKNMDTAVYKYHTADGRHDFANWVEDVLVDTDCAAALRKAKTPKSAHTIVVKHLAVYK
jgi:outer membrane protein assembly factor BamD (BamD/ComL family)